jgi:hypothetical protein
MFLIFNASFWFESIMETNVEIEWLIQKYSSNKKHELKVNISIIKNTTNKTMITDVKRKHSYVMIILYWETFFNTNLWEDFLI